MASLRKILPVLGQTLNVARVSVWSFDDARTRIRGIRRDDLAAVPDRTGTVREAVQYPGYFRAMQTSDVIAADDAAADPRTSEMAEAYLKPSGITSMMDIPVAGAGNRWGIVCHEH